MYLAIYLVIAFALIALFVAAVKHKGEDDLKDVLGTLLMAAFCWPIVLFVSLAIIASKLIFAGGKK
jgi:xanthine/uracil permease